MSKEIPTDAEKLRDARRMPARLPPLQIGGTVSLINPFAGIAESTTSFPPNSEEGPPNLSDFPSYRDSDGEHTTVGSIYGTNQTSTSTNIHGANRSNSPAHGYPGGVGGGRRRLSEVTFRDVTAFRTIDTPDIIGHSQSSTEKHIPRLPNQPESDLSLNDPPRSFSRTSTNNVISLLQVDNTSCPGRRGSTATHNGNRRRKFSVISRKDNSRVSSSISAGIIKEDLIEDKSKLNVPILLHFVFFAIWIPVLTVVSGNQISWGVYLFYISSFIAAIEISRLTSNNRVLLHMTILPYASGVMMTHPWHAVFALSWTTSIIMIYISQGIILEIPHYVAYVGSHIGLWILYISIAYGLTNTISSSNLHPVLRYNFTSNIVSPYGNNGGMPTWGAETVYAVGLIALSFALFRLSRYIRLFLLISQQREKAEETARQEIETLELGGQITKKRREGREDLESPVNKVITTLKSIYEQKEVNYDTKSLIIAAINILSSNALFSPDLDDQINDAELDPEVRRWLQGMVPQDREKSGVEGRRGGIAEFDADLVALTTVNPGQETGIKVSESSLTQLPVINTSLKKSRLLTTENNKDSLLHLSRLSQSQLFLGSSSSNQIDAALKSVDEWDFNIFALSEASNGSPLLWLSVCLYGRYEFNSRFNIDKEIFCNFMTRVEKGYKDNPYHNKLHAADVMQSMHAMIYYYDMTDDMLTMTDVLSGLVSAAVHDLEHPGYNNAFMINTNHPLALRYNDQAVLENYHCARAFEYLVNETTNSYLQHGSDDVLDTKNDELFYNIFVTFDTELFRKVRQGIISAVMATDMSKHFEFLSKFKAKMSGAGFDFTDEADRQLLLNIVIKCADISNPSKKQPIMRRWVDNIMNEFWLQGDEEREKGLPISMFMDRYDTNVPKCQIGFIDYIVFPLFEAWDTFMAETDEDHFIVDNILANREYWERKLGENEDPAENEDNIASE